MELICPASVRAAVVGASLHCGCNAQGSEVAGSAEPVLVSIATIWVWLHGAAT
jgi:hypothetical protein